MRKTANGKIVRFIAWLCDKAPNFQFTHSFAIRVRVAGKTTKYCEFHGCFTTGDLVCSWTAQMQAKALFDVSARDSTRNQGMNYAWS